MAFSFAFSRSGIILISIKGEAFYGIVSAESIVSSLSSYCSFIVFIDSARGNGHRAPNKMLYIEWLRASVHSTIRYSILSASVAGASVGHIFPLPSLTLRWFGMQIELGSGPTIIPCRAVLGASYLYGGCARPLIRSL